MNKRTLETRAEMRRLRSMRKDDGEPEGEDLVRSRQRKDRVKWENVEVGMEGKDQVHELHPNKPNSREATVTGKDKGEWKREKLLEPDTDSLDAEMIVLSPKVPKQPSNSEASNPLPLQSLVAHEESQPFQPNTQRFSIKAHQQTRSIHSSSASQKSNKVDHEQA